MPVYSTPPPDAVIPTKRVSHPDWDTEGKYAEYFEILSYLRPEVLKAAQDKSRRTITERGKPARDEYDDATYFRVLFDTQLKGWRLFNPDLSAKPYTPEEVAALPLELQAWLSLQIRACNGIIATRELIVQTGDGTPLDFKSQGAGVGTEPEHERSEAGGVPAAG